MKCRLGLLFTVTLLVSTLSSLLAPHRAEAHFSYSDPRVVHVTETDGGDMSILVRMPAPLALLSPDWQGSVETRLPPFAKRLGDEIFLDRDALHREETRFHQALKDGLTVWLRDAPQVLTVGRTRFWPDADRPSFGTAKTALKSFERDASTSEWAYFDTTLDVEFIVPDGTLNAAIRIYSDQGAAFQVMENFGTVVKLYRDSGWETRAMIGVLRAEFPRAQPEWQNLMQIAWIGAEHIYRGFDHLAMVLLIAIAAVSWRQALFWASAFTVGHVLTLAAGLYGYAPQASWFVPLIEVLIAFSIVVAGAAIVLKIPHLVNAPTLFTIGLIHGYGFASAADVALFAGGVDAIALAVFALGLELCQFAVYLAVLPIIMLLDGVKPVTGARWRRPVALVLAAAAGISVIQQLMNATGVSLA